MNFSCNNKISNNQLLAVIVAAFLGCTAVSAPLGIIETAGGGAYISVFLGGFAASIFFYILVRLTGKRITDSYQNVVYNLSLIHILPTASSIGFVIRFSISSGPAPT